MPIMDVAYMFERPRPPMRAVRATVLCEDILKIFFMNIFMIFCSEDSPGKLFNSCGLPLHKDKASGCKGKWE